MVKRKDILRMSLVLLSNHGILQRNIKTSIKALFIKHNPPPPPTSPFPPKNNDEVQPDCFCAQMNHFGQGGVGGRGLLWCQICMVVVLWVRKGQILNTFCSSLFFVVVINSYTYSVLTTLRHCGICALLQGMPHAQGVTRAQTGKKNRITKRT